MKRVIIVHGYGGNPSINWFPWLKSQLEERGVAASVPNMPNTDEPELQSWLKHLQQTVGEVDSDTYLVGHSLGCPTVLRFLENLDSGKKVGGAILVAGFAEPIHFTELDGFTAPAWDDTRIRNAAEKIVLINSDNDPHVPLEIGQRMSDRFGADLVVMHGAEHINGKAGFTELPLVLEKLLDIMGITR